MTSLFSSDISIESALSRLPLNDDVTFNVPLQNSKFNDNYSQIYRNKATSQQLIQNIHPDLNTHQKLFNFAAKNYTDRPCLGYRPYNYTSSSSENHYQSFTYSEVYQKKNCIGSGILYLLSNNKFLNLSLTSHLKVKNHINDYKNYGVSNSFSDNQNYEIEKNCSFILSIFASNRIEWILVDLACSSYSITNTALYDTLGPDASQYILGLTESPIIVTTVDKIEKLINLKKTYPKELENVISIISMDPIECLSTEVIDQAKAQKIEIHDLDYVEKIGSKNIINELIPNEDSIFTISFTSGTTGSRPKGVMISQGSACAYVTFLLTTEPQANLGDTAYVYLPLTHLYERQTSAFAFTAGYFLGLPQLTVNKRGINPFDLMIDDLKILKPTYMSIVPRILTKLESLIKNKIKELPTGQQKIINDIINFKINQQGKYDGSTGESKTMDNYQPYNLLKSSIGFENMKWVQSASAPLSPSTIVYLKASLNMGIRQLYGMTETGAAITTSTPYDANPGTNGPISPTGEFKLRNVDDLGYDSTKFQGEIMMRGTQMFKGYFYNREETEKAISNEDGGNWIHSGDIAVIDPTTGRISIIDRVKNFFKLSQGEFVSPEKIENRYLSSNPQISQLFVYGTPHKSYLIGIVGIEFEKGLRFLNEEIGLNKLDLSEQELLIRMNEKDIKLKFLKKLNSNVRDKLSGFEILHNIHIEINPLTVEREVVTPTFKLRRPIASKFFAKAIDKLYELEESLLLETKSLVAKF